MKLDDAEEEGEIKVVRVCVITWTSLWHEACGQNHCHVSVSPVVQDDEAKLETRR